MGSRRVEWLVVRLNVHLFTFNETVLEVELL